MAINIKFTAQEIEVINSLKKQGEATAALVQKNIELANQYAKTDAESKFFARGLNRLKREAEENAIANGKQVESIAKTKEIQKKYLQDLKYNSFEAEKATKERAERQAKIEQKSIADAAERNRKYLQDLKYNSFEAERIGKEKLQKEAERAERQAQIEKKSRRSDIANGIASAVGFQFGGPAAGIGGAVGGLGGAAIGAGLDGLLAVGKEISATTERYNRLQMALDTATGSTIKGAEAFSFVTSLARQTGLRIDDLADSYKGFAAASRGTKLEGKETERIFTSIVKAGSAMMLSNEQVKGSLLAVSQMMSKGNVQAEELRGQLSERLPGAFNILAQEMGVTTAQLNDLLKAGAVLSEDALPKLAQGLDKISKDSYAKNLETTTGAMNNLRNEVDLAVVAFGRKTEINSFFASIINGAASVVRSGYLQEIGELAINAATAGGYGAYKNAKTGERKFEKITAAQAIGEAAQMNLASQKRRLDANRERIKSNEAALKGLKDLAPYEKKQIANLEKLLEVDINNYSLRKKAYDGERVQRAEKVKADENKLNLGKKEIAQLTDINKKVKEYAELLNDLRKKDPTGFTKSEAGKGLMKKIGDLNQEAQSIRDLAKLGKPSTGESEFEKQLRKENKAGEDLFKVRLAMIKQARLDAELIANSPAAFSNSSIGSPSQVFGKGVATIQTGGGSELLANAIQQDRLDKMVSVVRRKMLDKIEGLVYDINTGLTKEVIDLSKIKIKPVEPQFINDFDKSVKGSVQAIEKYFTDLGGVWEANAAIFGDIVGNGIGSALQNGFAGLGTAIATGENPFKAFGEGLVHAFGDMLLQAGQIMLAQAGLMLGASILSGGALSPFFAKTAATGAALTTAGAAIKAVKFADGGIVSGPTFSMTGEYRGAKSNPEVIAPLSRLGNLLNPYFQRAVNMGRYNSPQLATQPIHTQTNVYFDNKVLLTQIDKAIVKRGRI
jgi:tape measure domain-containing protein